jgi:hypothetical protein
MTDDADAPDNVRRLPGADALPENLMRVEAGGDRSVYCQHPSVLIVEHTRSLTCANPRCGAVLDPFDFVRTQGRLIQLAWENYDQAKRLANEAVDRVTALKAEEKRLRAMVKRLQEKTGAVLIARPNKGNV